METEQFHVLKSSVALAPLNSVTWANVSLRPSMLSVRNIALPHSVTLNLTLWWPHPRLAGNLLSQFGYQFHFLPPQQETLDLHLTSAQNYRPL